MVDGSAVDREGVAERMPADPAAQSKASKDWTLQHAREEEAENLRALVDDTFRKLDVLKFICSQRSQSSATRSACCSVMGTKPSGSSKHC